MTDGTPDTVGFIGLGQMGKPIAINLRKGGAAVLAVGRSAKAFPELEAQGVSTTTDPARLAESAFLFLCLPDAAAVETLLFGENGLLPRLGAGQVVVDLGTTDYGATLRIAQRLAERNVGFLDAPISGMEKRAVEGTLTVMAGGDRAVFERVAPLFATIGSTVLHAGPTGSGQLVKLINQLLFDINAAAVAEIVPMAVKMGLDPELVTQVVNTGTGRSYASEFFLPRILQGHFGDGYPLGHAYKDLVGGAELGARQGIPMPVLAAATATYQTALLRGHGAKDKGAMVLVFEELLGVRFRSAAPDQGGAA